MKSLFKQFKWPISTFLALGLMGIIILATPLGLKVLWDLWRYSYHLPISITSLHGSLLTSITAQDLRYQGLQIRQLQVGPLLPALQNKRVALKLNVFDNTIKGTLKRTAGQWSLKLNTHNEHIKGTLTVKGSPAHYRLQTQLAVDEQAMPQTQVKLSGEGDQTQFKTSNVIFNTLGGQLTGTLTINYQPQLNWTTKLFAKQLNPGRYWQDLPGQLNFALQSKGHLEHGQVISELTLDNLSGQLRETPVSGQVHLTHTPSTISFYDTKLKLGDNLFSIDNKKIKNWQLVWRVVIPNLSSLHPQFAGTLSSQGDIQTTLKSSTMINAFQWAHSPKTNLKITTDGDAKHHHIKLTADNEYLTQSVQIKGRIQDHTWHGRIHNFSIDSVLFGKWKLKEPGKITLQSDTLQLSPLCWHQNSQNVCLRGHWSRKGDWHGKLDVKDLLPNPLLSLTHWQFRYDHPLDLALNIQTQSGKHFGASFRGHTAAGFLSDEKHPNRKLHIDSLTTTAIIDEVGMDAKLNALFNGKSSLHALLMLPQYNALTPLKPTQKIQGKIKAKVDNLNFLNLFLDDIENVSGQGSCDLQIEGNLAAWQTHGNLQIRHAHADVKPLGITLEHITAHAQSDHNGKLTYSVSAQSGKGKLTVQQTKQHLALNGSHFELVNTPNLQLYVSPKLIYKNTSAQKTLTGDITIPTLTLHSEEQTMHPTNPIHKTVNTRVSLTLGDEVKIMSPHFTGRIKGHLDIREQKNAPSVANGVLHILDGKLMAYGMTFNIDQGQLIYHHAPLSNPNLHLRASRHLLKANLPLTQITTTTPVEVGFRVKGPLTQPTLTLFSTPTLAEGDLLSYLVFGKNLSHALTRELGALTNIQQLFNFKDKQHAIEITSEQPPWAKTLGDTLDITLSPHHYIGLIQAGLKA